MIPNKDKHDVQYTECKKISTSCDCLIIHITSCSPENHVNAFYSVLQNDVTEPRFTKSNIFILLFGVCSIVQINKGNVIHFLIQRH